MKVNICYVAYGTFFRIFFLTFDPCVHNALINFTRIFVRGKWLAVVGNLATFSLFKQQDVTNSIDIRPLFLTHLYL